MDEFTLDVEAIAHLAQLIQLALFTQTDISEQMMLLRLSPSKDNPNKLVLSDSYKEQADSNIENLLKKAEEASKEMTDERDPIIVMGDSN